MILYRYIASELLKAMLAVTFVVLIIIVSSQHIRFLTEAADGQLAVDFLFRLLVYRLPNFLEMVIPLGLFLGILLSFGRLYVDSEITVMNACGISRMQLLKLSAVPVAVVTVMVGLLTLVVTPASVRNYEALLVESKASYGLKAVHEGQFRVDDRSGRVTYIEQIDRATRSMTGVFIVQPLTTESGRSLVSVVSAGSGYFEENDVAGQRLLVLDHGVRYVGEPGTLDYQVANFERYGQWIEGERVARLRKIVDGRSTTELLASNQLVDRAALQWRVSLVLLVPIVALLAIALSKTDYRSGRYTKMFPAFVIYMVYLVFLNTMRESLAEGDLPLFPGLWGVHILFLALGLLLLKGPDWWRSYRYRYRQG